jgi:thioredoxin-like negative regulator of GroEL
MPNVAPFRALQFFALIFGLMVLAWATMGGAKGGQAPMPRMFEEGLTYEQAAERSMKEGKPIFAVFSATWCRPCQQFKRGALSDPRVEKTVKEGFIPAYVDIDEQRSAAKKFKVSGVPAMAVIKGGERIRGAIGMLDAEVVLKFLEEAGKDAEKKPAK